MRSYRLSLMELTLPVIGTIAAFGDRTIHTYHTEGAGKFRFKLTS